MIPIPYIICISIYYKPTINTAHFALLFYSTDYNIIKIWSRITSYVRKSVCIHTRNTVTYENLNVVIDLLWIWLWFFFAKSIIISSHSFDPDSDSSDTGFLELIAISITLLYIHVLIFVKMNTDYSKASRARVGLKNDTTRYVIFIWLPVFLVYENNILVK